MVRQVMNDPPETRINWDAMRDLRVRAVGVLVRVKNNIVMTASQATRDGRPSGDFDNFVHSWSRSGSDSPADRGDRHYGWAAFVKASVEDTDAVYFYFDTTAEFTAWFRNSTYLTF